MDFTRLSPQEIADLAIPTVEFADILKSHQPPSLDWTDSPKLISLMRHQVDLFVKADIADPDVGEETLRVSNRTGVELPLKVWRRISSSNESSSGPLIVLYFGGGFIMGDPDTLAPLARPLVKQLDAVVVAPTYRLAPEHPFPASVDDCWDCFSWIAAHTSILRADTSKGFIVGGISSGGNVANAVAHLARDNGLRPRISGVWLSCAAARVASKLTSLLPEKYSARYISRTQDECVNSIVTSPDFEKLTKTSLQPDRDSRLYAPLIWTDEGGESISKYGTFGHKFFPKTYFQVAGMEAPRDEALIFDDMLKDEGVRTRLDLYPGLPHAFWLSHKSLPQSKNWESRTLEGFRWLSES